MKQNLYPQYDAVYTGRLPLQRRVHSSLRFPGLALFLTLLFSMAVPAQDGVTGPTPVTTEKVDSVKVRLGEFEMEVGLVLVRGDREFENFVPLVVQDLQPQPRPGADPQGRVSPLRRERQGTADGHGEAGALGV